MNYCECECGEQRHRSARACHRCTQLDGKCAAAEVIAELRIIEIGTARDLAKRIGKKEDAIAAVLRRLAKAGRLRRIDPGIPYAPLSYRLA